MEHNRFFIPSSQITQTQITITDIDNLHHIRVIRLGINDEIVVLDGKGNEYRARISSISKEQIVASITDHLVYPSLTLQITIVQSIPKLDKINLIVEKCTELGVSRIVLVETTRSVKKQINLPRLERIAISACSQSGRIFLPIIEEARFCDALAMVRQEREEDSHAETQRTRREEETPLSNVLGLMLWEEEDVEKGISRVLRGRQDLQSVVLFVGPEGGFSHEEADEATRMGIIPVSIGSHILRTETAGLVGLTIVAYEMGLLGG
ncbi:MAG: RsmE family RNA methyltransferase [Candidatus Desantisbacteria bacterium]